MKNTMLKTDSVPSKRLVIKIAVVIGLFTTSLAKLSAQESTVPALVVAQAESKRAESKRAFPDFTWDRIPLYLHIRKSTSFTDDEIKFIAKFPLVTFEKANGYKSHDSVEKGTLVAAKAVKKINPAAKLLYYRNVFVHYGNYAVDSKLENISSAFLRDQQGNTKLVRNHVPAYDLSNADLRHWWVNACQSMTADAAIDGIFLDGNIKALEPRYLSKQIGVSKKKQAIDAYHLLMQETRKAIGPSKLMVANILRARFENGGLEYLDYFDGSYLEGFYHSVGEVSYEDYVAKGIKTMQTAARQGKIIAFTTGLAEPNSTSQMGIDEAHAEVESDEEAQASLTYPLGIFLICAERHSYFRVHEGYSADKNDRWMRWFAEYDRPLGPPTGPAKKEGYRYSRDFQHASVTVDLVSRTSKILWRKPAGISE